MKLFLDDVRELPDNTWFLFRTARTLLQFVWVAFKTNGQHPMWKAVEVISFDNDLGENALEGYKVLDELEYLIHEALALDSVPHIPKLQIHSANPVARARMAVIIARLDALRDSYNGASYK
jgi:hypothetical protein